MLAPCRGIAALLSFCGRCERPVSSGRACLFTHSPSVTGRRLSCRPMSRTATSFSSFSGSNATELTTWLEQHGVDTAAYGKGMAKTVQELLEEMQLHESVLQDEPDGGRRAVRVVRVLSLNVTNSDGLVLYEAEQVLPDGRVRRRDVMLSEKMVGAECWKDAALRAVAEELGTILPVGYQVVLDEETHHCSQELSESMSFPGLQTQYNFHRVCATVSGLPTGPFSTTEERPKGQLLTRWVWRELHTAVKGPAPGISSTD